MLTISVIIPVYKAEAFLKKAVASALQHKEVTEILLIEDASPDHSLLICEELAAGFDKVKLYQHPDRGNHGAGASRNLGLEKATAELIAFLDADDYYLLKRFEAEKELFKNEKVEGVFGAIGTAFLSEKGKQEFREKFKDITLTTVNYAAEGEQVFTGLLGLNEKTFGTFFHLNALTVRTSSVRKFNLKFNPELRVHQDSDFIIKLAYHCHLHSGIIDKAVAVRGVHDDNRITKIARYSKNYNDRQFYLWQSLFRWSKTVPISLQAQEKIYLQYTSFQLAKLKGMQMLTLLCSACLKNPKILRTQYRFTYLKR